MRLLKQREEELRRKRYHEKTRNNWDKKEKLLAKKSREPTPSVVLKLQTCLKKTNHLCTGLRKLYAYIIHEVECPKRKTRQEKIRKRWAKKEKFLDKKHSESAPAVTPYLEDSRKNVEALLKQHEEESSKRERRHEKIRKHWAKQEKLLDKKHSKPTPSVAPMLEACLKKADEQYAEFREPCVYILWFFSHGFARGHWTRTTMTNFGVIVVLEIAP